MIPALFQIPTNFLQSIFMKIFLGKHISRTTIDCKVNLRICVTREAEQNPYDAALVKTTTDMDTILILD